MTTSEARTTAQAGATICSSYRIHPSVRVGHVHLRVADLQRATAFYRDVLGLAVTGDGAGVPLATLAAGDYHHDIALNTFVSEGGAPPPAGHTGLHHVALLYPDRQELARALRRIRESGHAVDGAEDHGATVSVYLRDPDGNGLELYYDQPRETWFTQGGAVARPRPFDPAALADEVSPAASMEGRS